MHLDHKDIIYTILNRGTEDIFIRENLEKKLKSGKKLRIKFGIDPTSKNIHLGRAVPLRKLKQLQDLGHTIILIVGDFTARIGDPSDKLEKRPLLTQAEIKKNMANYKKLIGKILNIKKTKFVYNSKWLSQIKFSELVHIAEAFSVNQLSSRRNFKERLSSGGEVSLREFLYPIMQGYDSVKVHADIEVGGFDQLFNLRAGRIIQKLYSQKEQDILTTTMLEGADGRKMSGSWGNVINIDDIPNDMFGKLMRINDELIAKYFLLCTDLPQKQIDEHEKDLHNSANPRDIKLKLATEVVTMYHGEKEAIKAKEYFITAFSKKEIPENVEEHKGKRGERLSDIAIRLGIVSSRSEFKRKCNEGAVKIFDTKGLEIKVLDFTSTIKETSVLKIGKHLKKIIVS